MAECTDVYHDFCGCVRDLEHQNKKLRDEVKNHEYALEQIRKLVIEQLD